MSDVKKIIGSRIRNLRNERNWSQEELAHRADISRSHMGRIERGEGAATIGSLEKVSNALEIEFEELFTFTNSKHQENCTDIIYNLLNKLNKRSLRDQKIILKLILDIIDNLPPWEEN